MNRLAALARLALALPFLLLVACGSDETPAPGASTTPRPASLAGVEGGAAPSDGQLPPGHPPIQEGAMPGMAPAPGGAALSWDAPEGWEAQTPSSSMRRAQYRVPGEAGDAELVVFYFGPGQGGDARSNAERWAGQFAQPGGSDPVAAMKTEETTVNGMKTMLVETTGTYQNSMAPMMGGGGTTSEGYMLLAAIVDGPDANWFFKLTGPEATVEAQRAAFQQLLSSLKPSA